MRARVGCALLVIAWLPNGCNKVDRRDARPAPSASAGPDALDGSTTSTGHASELPADGAAGGVPSAAPSTNVAPPDAEAEARGCAPLAAPPRTASKALRAKAPFVAKARYPVVESGDGVVDSRVLAIVGGDVRRRQDEFVSEGNRLLADDRARGGALGPERIDDDVDCAVTVVTRAMVGVACVEKSFLAGAYVNTSYFTYNVALCAGAGARLLSLDDLCSPGTHCKRRLAEALGEKLDAGAMAAVDVDLDDDADVFTRYAVLPHGLRFFVEQELPHALGRVPPVDVPFARLSDVLRHDGALTGLL